MRSLHEIGQAGTSQDCNFDKPLQNMNAAKKLSKTSIINNEKTTGSDNTQGRGFLRPNTKFINSPLNKLSEFEKSQKQRQSEGERFHSVRTNTASTSFLTGGKKLVESALDGVAFGKTGSLFAKEGSSVNSLIKSEVRDTLPLARLLKTSQTFGSKNSEVSPLSMHRGFKETRPDIKAGLSTPVTLSQHKPSMNLSQPTEKKHSLEDQSEKTSSPGRNDNSQLTSPLSVLSIQSSTTSPLSKILGSKRESEDTKRISTKTSPSLIHIPPADESYISPLSRLLKEKRSLSDKTSGAFTGGKINTNDAGKTPSLVHIPTNDGVSPLSRLLKARQAPKHDDCVSKIGLESNNNSKLSIGEDSKNGRAKSGSSMKKPLTSFPESVKRKDTDLSSLFSRMKTNFCEKLEEDEGLSSTESDSQTSSSSDIEDDFEQDVSSTESVLDFLHAPSAFACALLVYYEKPGPKWEPDVTERFQNDSGIVPFDFSTVSPDDFVLARQKKARLPRK